MNDLEMLKRESSTLRRRFGSAALFAVLLTIVCGFVFMAIPAVMIRVQIGPRQAASAVSGSGPGVADWSRTRARSTSASVLSWLCT
jgi:hypothetical protein